MTGLEIWAEQQRSTPEEIKILMTSEGMDLATVLKGSLDSGDPIPAGRATALCGLLSRGRAGSIPVPFSAICDVMGCDPMTVDDVIGERRADAYYCCTIQKTDNPAEWTFHSAKLPILVLDLKAHLLDDPSFRDEADRMLNPPNPPEEGAPTDAGTDKPNDADAAKAGNGPVAPAKPAEPTAKPAPRTAARRKTKYSMTKAAAMEMFRPVGADMSVREIRAFLLSMPEHRPQDVALMSDKDAADAFGKDYVCAQAPTGTLIMPRRGYDALINFMSGNEIYYIPAQRPDGDAG